MAISIDRSTFPAEGGSFQINITKDDNKTWGVITIPSANWYSVDDMNDVSTLLYQVDVTVDENTSGSQRIMSIGVTVDGQSELFSITQDSTSTLSADIIAYTPSGNVSASGGNITVDVYANGGTDSLSSATSSHADCTLTSTTHGVTSGGYTCTRFVFTFAANATTSTKSTTLTFTVSDGNSTATATLTKTQNALSVSTGSMSVPNTTVAAATTTASVVVTATDMVTSTIAVSTTTFNFVTSAEIEITNGVIYLQLAFPANSSTTTLTDSITITGTDNYGNTITATMTLTQTGTSATYSISAAWRDNLGYDGVLDYTGGTEQALVSFTGTFTGSTTVSTGTLPDGVTVTTNGTTVVYGTYTGGNITETVTIPITISRTGDDSVTYTTTLNLILKAGGVFPIWSDTYGTIVSNDDFEDYELQESGTAFYSGRAFAYPDETDIRVNISRVVAPYLTSYYMDVDFYADATLLGSYTFVRDYSYDESMDYTSDLWLNAPINGRIPSGMQVSASKWGAAAGGSMQVTDANGTLVVNETMAKGLNEQSWISGSVGSEYTFGDWTYEVVDVCNGALLKYVNAYGAVDYFLVEGVTKKKDSITRSSYEKDADALSSDFETTDYQAAMEAGWTGTTGWLTDAQSLRMKHLVESVEVSMIDLATGDEIPVNMRDNGLDYKTWRTNGKKLVNYTLTWKESQKKLRR